MLLFCLAHAGGSTIAYEKWKPFLSSHIQFVPLELPGHIRRAQDPVCTDFYKLIEDLTSTVCSYIDNISEDYVLFGHSLGSVLSYYLYLSLAEQGKRLPVHIIFSGRWPPFVYKENIEIADSEYIYMDEAIANSPELYQYFRNIILSDFELLKNMPKTKEPKKIDTEMSIVWGTDDPSLTYEDMKMWQQVANNTIHFYPLPGDHLFPIHKLRETSLCINRILSPYQKT